MWGEAVPSVGWHHHDAFERTLGRDLVPTLIQVPKASQRRSPAPVAARWAWVAEVDLWEAERYSPASACEWWWVHSFA